MIDRSHTEKFLRLNGVATDAPSEEIRTVLIRARWHKDDVDAAIEALNRPPDEIEISHSISPQLVSTDTRLAPETLNAVLGIDVEVTKVNDKKLADQNWFVRKQIISLVLVSLLGAALFMVTIMWQLDIGLQNLNL